MDEGKLLLHPLSEGGSEGGNYGKVHLTQRRLASWLLDNQLRDGGWVPTLLYKEGSAHEMTANTPASCLTESLYEDAMKMS